MDINSFILSAKDFLWDKQFLNLFISTIVLFLASLVSWYIYSKQLAQRDLFKIKLRSGRTTIHFFDRIVYFLKYLIVFPVYSFMWFLLFSFLLFLLSKSRPIEDILYFGIIIVAATRIGAYVSEKLAEDMAKLLPWSIILIFLIDPAAVTIQGIGNSIITFVQHTPKVMKYLLFIIVLEWILRISYWIFKPKELQQQ